MINVNYWYRLYLFDKYYLEISSKKKSGVNRTFKHIIKIVVFTKYASWLRWCFLCFQRPRNEQNLRRLNQTQLRE